MGFFSYSEVVFMDYQERIEEIKQLMNFIIEDTSVPRNIRGAVSKAKEKIQEEHEDKTVVLAEAIYILDEIANDINIPLHARTQIWNLIAEIERLKEDLKKEEEGA